MKKLLAVTATLFFIALSLQAKGEKVRVLHNGHVIEISENALKAHLKHGDEVLVLHEGVWMTEAERQAIIDAEYQQYQDATVEEEGEFDEEGEEA